MSEKDVSSLAQRDPGDGISWRESELSSRVYASEADCNDYPDGSSLEQLRQGRKQPGQNLG